MRGARFLCILLSLSMVLVAFDADARRRRRRRKRRKKAPVASKAQRVAAARLLAPFKWGMTPKQVTKLLERKVRRYYRKKLKRASKEPLEYDRVRREMMKAIKKVKNSHIKFDGKRTSWDVSLIDKEFAQKNNESMIVRWRDDERRFYFFHNKQLWKVYIAFNASRFRGKTFKDFAAVMEARFGAAERKFRVTVSGKAVMAYLNWSRHGRTMLRAIDNTGFYGNFCLVLLDKRELNSVNEGRKVNSPKKRYSDPLVNAVTRKSKGGGDDNADVVDQITGKGSKVPGGSSTPARTSSPGKSPPPSTTTRKRRKINRKNPLDGLDI